MQNEPIQPGKLRNSSAVEGLTPALSALLGRARARDPWRDGAPIRDELLSAERLEEYARSLASAQSVSPRERAGASLVKRLTENEAMLSAAYRDIAKAIDEGVAITPAAEWLVDNFHVVEKQIRDVKGDLPSGYYRQLPKLAGGPLAQYPRVFGVAWAFVAHTDSLFEPEILQRFLRAYQEVQPLTIGELWAVAITLKIVLVENLRRIATRVVDSRASRKAADALADRLVGARGTRSEHADSVLTPGARASHSDAFLVQLVHRLRDQDPSLGPALQWLDEQFERQGTTAEAVVRDEHQRQVSASITVRNIITSMRLISDVDWSDQFEHVSLVDEVLSVGTDFQNMDFATRNIYRDAVETLSRGSGLSELDVARAAVAAAEGASAGAGPDLRMADPGYYLFSGGRLRFESAISYQPPLLSRPSLFYRDLGIGGYVGLGGLVAAGLLLVPLSVAAGSGLSWLWCMALAGLGLVPAVDLAVALVNHFVTQGIRATLLPALKLRGGVPDNLRTLLVVPTLLTSVDGVEEQISNLEIHHLASPLGEIHFALLSDWADADAETQDSDRALLIAAQQGIDRLNQLYDPAPTGPRFLLLHRRRVWNSSEGCWIGWERKRGKLTELNHLLRGAGDTTFLDPPKVPAGVRFVITLDSDTRLPRETVARLIGKMAHPLNHPRVDPASRRVVEGYAILQPRVTPSLPVEREGSLFLRIFSRATGIDPYAAAVSDVYQDLFGEGSYTGKGIYDVDAFEAAMKDRVPESTLLSHDLFEGVFARAGLASDVEVVEEFPGRYDVAALRHHRWARGDWQLLPWILGPGSRSEGKSVYRGVPAIGRWKMLDNLRRTLSAPAVVLALIVGWALPFKDALVWTGFILLTIALPPLVPVIAQVRPPRPGVNIRSHARALGHELGLAAVQIGLMLVFLGHQAWLMGDAIVRTLVRLTTRRHLLEWVPMSQAVFGAHRTVAVFYRRMLGPIILGVTAVGLAWIAGQGTWPLALMFAGIWFASPALALWVGISPKTTDMRSLGVEESRHFRLIARHTWRYFETFVTPQENFLPPDNFQETPDPVVAHRTSPTNIGLYLLSTTSARDFGWIGTLDALDRLEATLATVSRMEKYRGHLFNWYDTRDLRPLDPPYISSVDSGNLAGHLISIANACQDWTDRSSTLDRQLQSISDALGLVRHEAQSHSAQHTSRSVLWRRLDREIEHLAVGLENAGPDGLDSRSVLVELFAQAAMLHDTVGEICLGQPETTEMDLQFWANNLCAVLESHLRDLDAADSNEVALRLLALGDLARATALAMDFGFLINTDRMLLSIGYEVLEGRLDPSCYDLLASEARLASFMAIAKRDAPARHWFRLGRSVTAIAHGAALISWSGSMFEYLMPSLVMRAPADSLIEQTNRLIVRRQIQYAETLRTPWGISESAYNARDLDFTYQYSNFGVPGLGLKRGLADSVVVAPYATALASMIDPTAAFANFNRLETLGARGRYGFYEALDFTPARIPNNSQVSVVRAFMAHHQGMTITALADCLLGGLSRQRFHAEPIVQATELLLQERAPRDVTTTPPSVSETTFAASAREIEGSQDFRDLNPYSATPATQLLSNGSYAVMVTASGSGYSRWRDMAVTRWREDSTCDNWGTYVYLRDVATGEVWSATQQPVNRQPENYAVSFKEDCAEFSRQDGDLKTRIQVLVSAEDDAEVRRVCISNGGEQQREVEITSYAELVLGPQAADLAHPAFSKLFVETEHLANLGALVATRRRRTQSDTEIWAAHLAVVDGHAIGKPEFETDRARFLGRGEGIGAPEGAMSGRPLSGTTGSVLDPVFALRRRVRVAPGATIRIDFWTMVAASRTEVLGLIDKHHDVGAFERAAALAWTQAQVQLHHLGTDRIQARQYQQLASHMLFAGPTLRPPSTMIEEGRGGQPGLWGMGISGDLPILLVRIADIHQLDLVRESLQAIEYWRMKQLAVDLVILNEHSSSYAQDLQIGLETLVRASQSRPQLGDRHATGHIFMLRGDLISPGARALLVATARAILLGDRGRLSDQLAGAPRAEVTEPPRPRRGIVSSDLRVAKPEPGVEYFNGLGGFAEGGREYLTVLGPGQATPAPWINVVANPNFGFQVSAEGGGYAWSINSREHQLTPWSNDPITDPPGQALYIRDEETGDLWSPTASPIRDEASTYVAHHGWGYSRFEHASHGIGSELVEFVPLVDPVKISRLTLRNLSNRARRLSVTAYVEWVLGASRGSTAPFISTRIDPATQAIMATNCWAPAFAERVAFADLSGKQAHWTADRREFIGRNGSLSWPAALVNGRILSGRVGAGLDPCSAQQQMLELPPGGSVDVVFLLGDGGDESAARDLITRYRNADLDESLSEVRRYWSDTVGKVQVRTPDRSMDVMLNGWLTYQTLACRVWARSGFYQASGAYGFRDQLQDGMALATIQPAITREHLLRAASRQFIEGDVQHWWLPHTGQGVRTRISDDRAWLAFATAHYVKVTGDSAVLEETVPFLTSAILEPGEDDRFFQPEITSQLGSLFAHCARALDASLAVGAHGLPLIGGGDWNDGMNRVGAGGQGESVWLGWLLHAALEGFSALADARGDTEHAVAWRSHMAALGRALKDQAWDGHWYMRGWYDDGTPLGSALSSECRIDSIAQSWSVLSGVGSLDRTTQAMAAVERELIRPNEGLALLFTPPFDSGSHDPGYIKGYPPGLRENGGQYTHAALWSVMALAELGEGDKAAALFWMLNPINHARTRADVHRYKVEPYVVAADVYAAPGHVGRGGWTWYTGSAAWMQRAGIESILGLRIEGDMMTLNPCIPSSWPGFEIDYQHKTSRYEIMVQNPNGVQRGVTRLICDGETMSDHVSTIELKDDGIKHHIVVLMGSD